MEQKLNNVLFASQLRRLPQTSASSPASHGPARPFRMHHSAFGDVLGPAPSLRMLASSDPDLGGCGVSYFHEAGVFVPPADPASKASGDIWITSNILQFGEEAVTIEVCKLALPPVDDGSGSPLAEIRLQPSAADGSVFVIPGAEYEPVRNGALVMANGATACGSDILFCTQGQDHLIPKHMYESLDPHAPWIPSALVLVNPRDLNAPPRPLLNNFHGRVFNSVNDVAVHHPSQTIFFTDPDYGYQQGFKTVPQLPNAVWRYDPADGSVQMVEDGLKKPNGVVFSPDGKTCYVTDTDFIHGDGDMDGRRAGTIYAYDVRSSAPNGPPQLHSRRVFAFADCGAPDGVKCDTDGNVYTGCFDGVHVFNPGTTNRQDPASPDNEGKQRGCANLVFGPPGRLIILSETTVWEARLAAVGDLKGVR